MILHSLSEGKNQPGKNIGDDKVCKENERGDGGHVMISYNRTHQKLALKIRDDLQEAGYKVWIDVDKMG